VSHTHPPTPPHDHQWLVAMSRWISVSSVSGQHRELEVTLVCPICEQYREFDAKPFRPDAGS
jgi:hypothetical protein